MDLRLLSDAAEIPLQLAEQILSGFENAINLAELNTPQRLACFIGQTFVESDGYKYAEENLNYRAQTLMRIWPSHFPSEDIAEAYAHKEQAIANRAYAHRMGNGSEESGDGYLYRGRGWIQVTGKSGYKALSDATGIDFVSNPDAVCTLDGCSVSASVFWKNHNLNEHADNMDVLRITMIVNGGENGLSEREAKTNHAFEVLSQDR